MAATKGGSVYVELVLDKDQFDKDFKAASRDVAAVQKQLSLEMQRNKVNFEVDGVDKSWADKLFGSTVIGKIRQARQETQFLNAQIGFQKNKVDIAKGAWDAILSSKGALSAAATNAEKTFLREQLALAGLKKDLEGTTSASSIMTMTTKNAAMAIAAAVAAIAAAYATATKAAVEWGQAVNDIVDETGMADQEAARLLGTMNIVGVTAGEAAGALAKMAKSIDAAAKAQQAAARAGKDSEDIFSKFGIAITDSSGQLLTYSQIMTNIQEVHGKMQDGLQKTALEMAIFGKAGYKMNDFLNLSKEQMAEYTQKIDKMGLSIKDSQKYEDFNRQLNEMSLALKGMAVTLTGDSVPAIAEFISKMTELSAWMKDNKEVLDELRGVATSGFEIMAYPFIKGLELAGEAIKKYAALRKKELDDKKPLTTDSTIEDVAAAAKIAEKNAQKAADAAREKAAMDKELALAQRELYEATLTLQGNTLAVTLQNIAKEKEAWIKKTQDEVAATKWAEAAKTKAFQDTVDARLGEEVRAAKEAIKNGTSVIEAIRKASEARLADEKATYEARSAVRDFYGIKMPGDTQTKLNIDELNHTITSFKETIQSFSLPTDKYGRTVFDSYQPAPADKLNIRPGGDTTINVPVTVNVNGMDAYSAEQLGQIAAQKILPEVKAAIAGNSSY